MDKKYQVFISSTYTDLIIERQEVVEAVLNAGHIPAGMELFKAGPTQEEIIREWIEESDIYVLILGPRYGSLNETGISYTQWEYNLAKELGKPMFSIVLDDPYMEAMVPDRIKAVEFETTNPKYQEFRSEVMSSLVAPISHIAEIRSRVSDSIRDIERRYPEKLEGWIKGSYLNELEELREKNKELFEKLTNRQDEVIDMQKELRNVKDDYIGTYKFSYVKNALIKHEFDYTYLEKELARIKTELAIESGELDFFFNVQLQDYKSELEKINDNRNNALEWLISLKEELLTDNLGYNMENSIYRLTNKYIFSKWYQYSLIDKKIIEDSSYVIITLNRNGLKLLSMLEMEEDQTK